MAVTTYGQPATISEAPTPRAAVSIVSSTNASPTVITATAHGMHTGEAVIVNGHATNTNANGVWIVTRLTADTFKISTFAGFPGTFINGNGVGGATGTVQSLALPGADLAEDAVDDDVAATWNTPVEALLNMVAFLAYRDLGRIPAPLTVGDSPDLDASLDCSYEEYRVPNTLAAGRTYTLISTAAGVLPTDGKRLRFSRTGSLLTQTVTFKREDATTIASFAAGTPAGVEFVFRSSDGEWHVSAWSGNTTVSAVV